MADVETWSRTPSDNDQVVPNGAPERHARSSVNDIHRELMASVRTFLEDAEWLDLTQENGASFAIQKAGPTSFLVQDDSGVDATSKFDVGSWVRVTGTGSPTVVYGYVASRSYVAPNLTVTLAGIVDTSWVSASLPATTVDKVENYISRTAREAAFHPVGATTGQSPAQIPTIDMLGDGATLDQGPGGGFDADTLDGLHASAFQLVSNSRNAIVNGGFDVWRRGESFTTPADGSWVADMWALLAESALWDVDLEVSDLPSGFHHGIRLTANGTSSHKAGIIETIEAADSRQIIDAGVASLSYWVKCPTTSGIAKIRAAILEWSGTEDAPTLDWVSSWGAEGTDPTPVAFWAVANTPVDDEHAAADAWTEVTIENVAISPGAKNLAVFVWIEDKTFANGDIVRFTGVNLTPGASARQFVPPLQSEEVLRCQRCFWSSYDYPVAPGTAGSDAGRLEHPASRNIDFAAGQAIFPVRFPIPMFKTPTVTVYATGTGAAGNATHPTGDLAASAINVASTGCSIQVTGDPATGVLSCHVTAEAPVSA